MFMRPRAWWYEHFIKREAWPRDVREYIIRSGLKTLKKANLSPEKQSEIATMELMGALEDENLSSELKSDLLGDAMKRLGEIPLEHCANCGRPVFTHEAKTIAEKPYCKSCGSRKSEP